VFVASLSCSVAGYEELVTYHSCFHGKIKMHQFFCWLVDCRGRCYKMTHLFIACLVYIFCDYHEHMIALC
jgi:hypothetical protein